MENLLNNTKETHFNKVHSIIQLHRSRALKVVNNESLLISWNVGLYVATKLKSSEWGKKIVTQLSEYLRTKDPSLRGYSRRNIYNMVLFYESYSSVEFQQLLVASDLPKKIQGNYQEFENKEDIIVQFETAQLQAIEKMPKLLGFINWTNHVEILSSCKLSTERLFYILYANKEKLEVKELKRAIKTNAYAHIIKTEDNQSKGMKQAYPEANYLFKDVAYLDFLGLPKKHSEKSLQKGIIENMGMFHK